MAARTELTRDAPRRSRYLSVSPQAKRMLALGESGRFEFKSDVKSVSSSLLACLANAVALDSQREAAQLLVGVAERTDEETGLVRGEPCGLPRGLDKAVEHIQNVARETRPIPVDIFVVEEAVEEETPFVRVEVRPTMAPHYDGEGRRQTRQGRSTRPLTDDELLRVYLDREAGAFAARFRQTSEELQAAVGAVGTQIDQIERAIEQNIALPLQQIAATASRAATAAALAESAARDAEDAGAAAAVAASSAESTADAVGHDLRQVDHLVSELYDVVEDLSEKTPELLAARVAIQRRHVWWNFSADTWNRRSDRAERLAVEVQKLLSDDIALDDGHNTWELRIWRTLLAERDTERGGRGTLKWWEGAAERVKQFRARPSYAAPELPNLRAELQADVDAALDHEDSLVNRYRMTLLE